MLEIHAIAVRAPGFRTLPIVVGTTPGPQVGDTAPFVVTESELEEVVL